MLVIRHWGVLPFPYPFGSRRERSASVFLIVNFIARYGRFGEGHDGADPSGRLACGTSSNAINFDTYENFSTFVIKALGTLNLEGIVKARLCRGITLLWRSQEIAELGRNE